MAKHTHPKIASHAAVPALALALTLCTLPSAWAADESAKSFADVMDQMAWSPSGKQDSEVLSRASVAIGYIKKMDLPRAQQAINEALQLDTRNSYLHFLNGFIYHLQAKQGDTQKTEIAIEGYQQALRMDPSNWIAQEFLALAYMDMKQFAKAKTQFSEVLLMTPDSTVSIQGLMVTSYLTGDAATACAMADQFQRVAAQPHQGFVRSSIPVYASCGQFDQAERMQALLTTQGDESSDTQRLSRRVAQWKSFYQQHEKDAGFVKVGLQKGGSPDEFPQRLAQAFTVPDIGAKARAAASTPADSAAPDASSAASASTSAAGGVGPRMVLIDVVLLSTQELIATSKGVNLLSALTLQLGSVSGNVAGYSKVVTTNGTSTTPSATTTAITRAVTIPALSYSLNIANANSSVNEVLARPTLAAIEGLPSEFFSGTNLSAGVVSTSQQGGTTIVPLDKRFGIKLGVTPVFLPKGQVQLKVEAQRTSLNANNDNPKVAYQVEIAETTANANVVMNLGETLVLSGLSEKTSASTRDGVPGLQDIPVLQYFFSNSKTNDIQRSVLILVTPRAPAQVGEASKAGGDTSAELMKSLRDKFGLSASVPANIEAIMNQLKPGEFFREFRQGDVSMERWDHMRSTGDRLREALGFLYY